MPLDPWEVLGVGRDASLAEANAAYRRVAALFHPDHLQGLSQTIQAEGARRLREATAALEALRLRPGGSAAGRLAAMVSDPVAESRAYNAQVRGLSSDGLHATWPGRHAAATWEALRRAHSPDGPVQQVEWGAYECTIRGAGFLQLLRGAMAAGGADWRREPLETLDLGPAGQRRRYVGCPGKDPPGVMDLEALAVLVDDGAPYLVTAEVFSSF
jgi:hypothetical protein